MTIPQVSKNEIAILKELKARKAPVYGLELVHDGIASRGGVYVELRRLEKKGLVMSEREGRERLYELTDAGRGWLKARAILERYVEDRGIR